MKVLLTLSLATLLAACGGSKQQQDQAAAPQQPENTATAIEAAKSAEVPEVVVVRLKLDANGEVDQSTQPEMRVGNGETVSGESAANFFANAKSPEMVSSESELDADSSTQSWIRWGAGCFRRNYWHGWRPRVCGYGYAYNYSGFYTSYSFGGYRYNCYGRGW
jgi:hypothetical protein